MSDTTALLPHIKLRFNIEHPSYEECYVFGYECALAEVTEEENPFREGSQEAEQWLEGWWAAAYGEDPLFDLEDLKDMDREFAANDSEFGIRSSLMSLVLEVGGAIAASAIVGYQILELVA